MVVDKDNPEMLCSHMTWLTYVIPLVTALQYKRVLLYTVVNKKYTRVYRDRKRIAMLDPIHSHKRHIVVDATGYSKPIRTFPFHAKSSITDHIKASTKINLNNLPNF